MIKKTKAECEHRLSQLIVIKDQHQLSLSESAELDAIRNHGVNAWNEWRAKRIKRGHRS